MRRDKHYNGGDGDEDKDTVPTAQFPYVIKIIERRLPNPVQPYCQKMSVNSDGSVSPVLNDKNKPIIIKISESDPSESEFVSAFKSKTNSGSGSAATASVGGNIKRWTGHAWEYYAAPDQKDLDKLFKRNDPSNSCVCQWLAQ
jgi:hypothetical protein